MITFSLHRHHLELSFEDSLEVVTKKHADVYKECLHALSVYMDRNFKVLTDKASRIEVSIEIVHEVSMRSLNKTYRDLDKPTDVLSFPVHERSFWRSQQGFESVNGPLHLGDVVICWPLAELQAKQLGHSVTEELQFLVFHGFAHLLGMDHEESAEEEKRMQQAEKDLYFLLPVKDA